MNRTEWMRGEIARWEQDGTVPPEVAGRLRVLYPVEVHAVPMAVMIFGCVGALLLALGVIALLAANWDSFGRSVRTVLSFLPLALCGAVALAAAIRGWTSRCLWEPLGILWAGAVCTGILMVSQIYQVTEDFPVFILACAAATLPVVYASRATLPLAGWPALLAIGVCSNWEKSAGAVLFWPFLFAAVPAFVHYGRRTPLWIGRGLVELGWALAVAIGGSFVCANLAESLPPGIEDATLALPFAVAALFAVMFLAGARFRLPVFWLVGLASLLGLAAVILPYGKSMREVFVQHGQVWTAGWGSWPMLAYALALAAAGAALLASTIRANGWKPALAFAALPLFVVTVVPAGLAVRAAKAGAPDGIDTSTSAGLALAGLTVLVGCGLATLVVGLRSKRLLVVNAGTCILLYSILAKFFASDASFTVKGVVMTALGAAVLAMNITWGLRRRRLALAAAGKEASK